MKPALVLCLSGHDPSGGAGYQADAEAIAAAGGHALGALTAYTVQDTHDVRQVTPADLAFLRAQVETLLSDCRISAIKVGVLGEPAQVPFVLELIARAQVPVVVDPVVRAGGGSDLIGAELLAEIRDRLIGKADVITPNAAEARLLAPGARTLEECGRALVRAGVRNVLVKGGDEPGDPVVNLWCAPGREPVRFEHPRLPGTFHGAGCTLASSIAVRLAQGLPMARALSEAQDYVHGALAAALAVGRGRKVPRRIGRGAGGSGGR